MNVRELMIGNFIYDDEGILSKITGFMPYDHLIQCNTPEGCLILIEQKERTGLETDSLKSNPVPLSEDFASKTCKQKNLYKNGIKVYEFFYFKIIVEGDDIWVSDSLASRDANYEKIQYIHEVQNLYLLFSGRPLEVNF